MKYKATLRQCVGVSGSERGSTMRQLRTSYLLLRQLKQQGYTQLRHGDCIGYDENMALMAWAMGFEIIGHPPLNDKKRAFFPSDFEEPPGEYLDRNHVLVSRVQYMLTAPHQPQGVLRDGTWATIRYAVRHMLAGNIIWRNGTTKAFSQVDFREGVYQEDI